MLILLCFGIFGAVSGCVQPHVLHINFFQSAAESHPESTIHSCLPKQCEEEIATGGILWERGGICPEKHTLLWALKQSKKSNCEGLISAAGAAGSTDLPRMDINPDVFIPVMLFCAEYTHWWAHRLQTRAQDVSLISRTALLFPLSYYHPPNGPDNKVLGASVGKSFVGGDGFSKKNFYFIYFFEDVFHFPGSGPVMDSNAAKEIIHSCPITTYEAPINTRSPGLGGRAGWTASERRLTETRGFHLLSDAVAPFNVSHFNRFLLADRDSSYSGLIMHA